MPESFDDTQTDDDDADSGNIKQLRERAKHAADLEKRVVELEGVQRENAMLRVGIDLSTPVGRMFARAFDGDVNDLDALREAAKEVGALTDPTEPAAQSEDEPPTDSDLAVAAAREAVTDGTTVPDTGEGIDSRKQAIDKARENLTESSYEDAASGLVRDLATAAGAGAQ